MKSWKKFLIVSLSFLFVASSVLAGLVNFVKVDNTSNNSGNQESGVVTPSSPDNYDGMVYYASDGEDSGASVTPREMKGGAVYVENGSTLNLEGGIIKNHEGLYGGAIYIANGGVVNMTSGTIEYNYSKYGGAIYVENGGTLNLMGGSIINNKAENAPAIYAEAGSVVTIGANAVLDTNDYITYNDTVINFYVDGELKETVYQGVPTLNLANVPLDYEESCGYFLDSELTECVEQGDDLTKLTETGSVQSMIANTSSNSYYVYNLYTKTATVDKLSFTLLSDEMSYSVKALNTEITSNVTIPKMYYGKNVSIIEDEGFSKCINLTNVTINSNIKEIPYCAFYKNDSLKHINITNAVLILNDWSFRECLSLDNIKISSSISVINKNPFAGCINLISMSVNENNKVFDSRENCNAIIDSEFDKLISGCKTTTLLGSLTSIGDLAFYLQSGIESIEILENIESIGSSTFSLCVGLKNVIFNNGLKELSTAAFFGCESLSNVVLPNSIEIIGSSAFQKCIGLTSVEIFNPEFLRLINETAFADCENLETVNFKNAINLTGINSYAFNNCGKLKDLNIDGCDKIENIGNMAFNKCISLENIYLPKNLKTIGNYAYANCTNLRIINYNSSNFTAIANSYVFSNSGLTDDGIILNVGENVLSLPNSLCEYFSLTTLKSLTFNENSLLSTIGEQAFANCSVLETIDLPKNLTNIGSLSFKSCTNLKTINYNIETIELPYNVYSFTDAGNAKTGIEFNIGKNVLEIPYGLTSFLKLNNISAINIDENSKCEKFNKYAFNYTKINSLDLSNAKELKTIKFQAFCGCDNLETVIINNLSNLEIIDNSAFFNCTLLNSVQLTNLSNLSIIGSSCFQGNTNLQNVDFTGSTNLKEIKDRAFFNSKNISQIELPDSVTKLGVSVFQGLPLSTINIPTALESIGNTCFADCVNLSTITNMNNANSLKTIGDWAFSQAKINSIDIPNSLSSIGKNAFYKCINVKTINYNAVSTPTCATNWLNLACNSEDGITLNIGDDVTIIPDGLSETLQIKTLIKSLSFDSNSICTTIGSYAFSECINLRSINFTEHMKIINNNAFNGCTSLSSINLMCVQEIGLHAFKGTQIIGATSYSTSNGSVWYSSYLGQHEYAVLDLVNDDLGRLLMSETSFVYKKSYS